MTLLAPEPSSSTRAFHGLGCLDSCCQAVGMCEEADIQTHANTSSDHDSINIENQGGSSAANEAMELFSALLTGLSAANLMNGQGTDAVLQDVALIAKHWEGLVADKENSTPMSEAEKQRRKRLRKSARLPCDATCHATQPAMRRSLPCEADT